MTAFAYPKVRKSPSASGQEYYVSPEQRKAILSLIGIWKTDQPPPTDEEVEKIIEEARMRKYG